MSLQKLLDPGEHEAKERRDADAIGDERQEYLMKKRGKEYPSSAGGFVDLARHAEMNPSRIHTARGTLKRQCASASAHTVSNRPIE